MIGKKIKDIRLQNKCSQKEFAEKINVTRQTVCNWEGDKTVPDFYNILTICKTFNCDLSCFVDDKPKVGKEEIQKEVSIQPHYIYLIALTGILSWIIPSLVVVNFIELIIFCFFIKVTKVERYLTLGICLFYTATFFIYYDFYYQVLLSLLPV